MTRSVSVIIAMMLCSVPTLADTYLCGDPPPLANEKLKGEVRGKAQFLSRFLGGAEVGGQIENTREEVLSKYPNADRAVFHLMLLYQTCVFLMQDDTLSTQQSSTNSERCEPSCTASFNLRSSTLGVDIRTSGKSGQTTRRSRNHQVGSVAVQPRRTGAIDPFLPSCKADLRERNTRRQS